MKKNWCAAQTNQQIQSSPAKQASKQHLCITPSLFLLRISCFSPLHIFANFNSKLIFRQIRGGERESEWNAFEDLEKKKGISVVVVYASMSIIHAYVYRYCVYARTCTWVCVCVCRLKVKGTNELHIVDLLYLERGRFRLESIHIHLYRGKKRALKKKIGKWNKADFYFGRLSFWQKAKWDCVSDLNIEDFF